jgi:hypothetical protein
MKCIIKDIIQDLQNQYKSVILGYLKSLQGHGLNDKLRTYSLIKSNHDMEPYIKSNIPKTYRCKIACLRVGSHNLEIEHGRYLDPITSAQNRFCMPCSCHIEDECHFITTCSIFKTERENIISKLGLKYNFKNGDNTSNFIHMLTNELKNEDSCLEVGKYIFYCFKKRSLSRKDNPLN